MKITRNQLKELVRQSVYNTISEDEDEKYTHIGYGKYKKKGQEKKKDAPTFTKDDSGKYVPLKGSGTGTKEKPKPTKTSRNHLKSSKTNRNTSKINQNQP